jgi:hypothetical protein
VNKEKKAIRHIFVDESGDLTLFNKFGKTMLGTEGVSNVFMLGFAEIAKPDLVRKELTELRLSLINDPYFNSAPSFNPARNKTACGFHAKDDLPEVRRMVYELLRKHEIKVQIAIRRKAKLIEDALFAKCLKCKITDKRIYEELITRLFKETLHTADVMNIVFSQRGTSNRNNAYMKALEQARRNFARKTGIVGESIIKLDSQTSFSDPCLQVIDYMLWPVYRLYEKQESRYFDYMVDKYSLIKDIDDTRYHETGEYYNRRLKISLDKIMPVNS